MPALAENDGDSSGSGTYLEDGIPLTLGQREPQRQICLVAPALEVVPDDAQLGSLQNWPA